MDVKSLIQGMLSPSKADLWVVMLYTNYLLAGMNFVKCVCKMEKGHYVVINVYHVTARVHLRNAIFLHVFLVQSVSKANYMLIRTFWCVSRHVH